MSFGGGGSLVTDGMERLVQGEVAQQMVTYKGRVGNIHKESRRNRWLESV